MLAQLAPLSTLSLILAATLVPEPGVPSPLPERIAFGLFLVGTIVFFGWVAWLVLRR